LRLGADPYAVVPATEATHDPPAGHRPLPSRLLAQASAQSQHQIFVLQPEHRAAPAAANIFVLIGNVLTARHEIGENPAERQIIGEAGAPVALKMRAASSVQRSVTSVDWNL
jgi:hypothetical protein